MDGKQSRSNDSNSQLFTTGNADSTTMESLKKTVTKLRGDLEAEQKNVKQLRREKTHQVQQVREQEATKAAVLLKDLRAKLREEKLGELEIQKEALNRKFEIDFQKVCKQKDVDITKLRKDLQRSQGELQEVTKRGLSGSAREAFEAERTRLLHDLQELRSSKRHLEEDLKVAKEAEKQRVHELKRIEEIKKNEVSKIKKEADMEIRKLLDELKGRERQLRHVEQELGSHTVNVTKLQLENDSMHDLMALARDASSWTRRSPSKSSPMRDVSEGGATTNKDEASGVTTPEGGELRYSLRELEERCAALSKDKEQLQSRTKELERKRRATQDKNKKFLEKNVKLTHINRDLEEQIKANNDLNTSQKTDILKANQQLDQLKECLRKDIEEQDTVQYLKQELEEFNGTFEEQDKTILALKMACMEKDRRIDLLAQRKRKQRRAQSHPKAAGLKETYYGYDEDCISEGGKSEDSDVSAQSCLSLSRLSQESCLLGDDSVFFEPKVNAETEQQFQQLSREHLELEKAYALLQSNSGCLLANQLTTPVDTGWQEEKENMNKTIKMLKDKVRSQETHEARLRHQLEEINEHNEVLEFRLLEMEDVTKNEAPSVTSEAGKAGPEDMETDSTVHSLSVKVGALEGTEAVLLARCGELEEQVTHLGDQSLQLQQELRDMVTKCQALEQELQAEGESRPASPTRVAGTQTEKDMEVDETSWKQQHEGVMETGTEDEVLKLTGTLNGSAASTSTSESSSLVHQGAPSEVIPREVSLLQEQVSLLEATRGQLQIQVDDLKESQTRAVLHGKDTQAELLELKSACDRMKEKMADVERELEVTRARELTCVKDLEEMEEQHNQRVHSLVQQVGRLESNENSLNETISDMKDLERELRNKLDVEEEDMGVTSNSNQELANQELEVSQDLGYSMGSSDDDVESIDQSGLKQPSAIGEHQLGDVDAFKYHQLQAQVKSLEKQLDASEKELQTLRSRQSGDNGVEELEKKVEDLTQREGDLMEDIYQMKLENQELQENIDALIEQQEDGSRQSQSESFEAEDNTPKKALHVNIIAELEDKVKVMEREKADLRDQLLKAKLDPLQTLDDIEELPEGMDSVEALKDSVQQLGEKCVKYEQELAELVDSEAGLKAELVDADTRELALKKKLELLLESEGRLMDQVKELEEEEDQLNTTIDRLQQGGAVTSESGYETLQVRVSELEQCKDELNRTVEELESGKDSMKHRLNEYHQHDNDELVRLQEKVEILLNTEEKLVDRIKEAEEIEEGLLAEVSTYKQKLAGHEKGDREKEVIDLSNEDEDLQRIVVELRAQLETCCETEIQLRNQVNEMEQSALVQQARLSDLKHHNTELVDALKSMRTRDEVRTEVVLDNEFQALGDVIRSTNDHVDEVDMSMSSEQQQSYMDSLSPYVPVDVSDINDMPRDEMMSKIHELQKMEIFHRGKISELTANLKSLRQAVEVVAISMETDADVPILKLRSATKDSEFEARLHELVRSEVSLKLRVLELEKKEGVFKRELADAEAVLREQETEFRHELEEQEHELDQARRQNARLRNRVEYGGESADDSASLAKIQHLEGLVFDLEGAERKIQRQVVDLNNTIEDLTERLRCSENNNNTLIKPGQTRTELDDREKLAELIEQIRVLQNSDEDLESRLITSDEAATKTALLLRVSDLERTEKGLLRKVDLLEALAAEKDHDGFIMLDSPEDVLRQRIKEHEKMEKHLRQQIVEMERDREELHEIARKDKNHIHELNVQLRELQLSEKGNKDQLNRMEVHENQLQNRVDELLDRVEELEELLRRLQNSEQRLKSELGKRQRTEDNLSLQLENSLEDLQSTEQKLQKKLNEMETARRELEENNFDLQDRVGDLEGTEVSLRQKVRTLENSDQRQKEQLNSLESREFDARNRNTELEITNEGLQHQVHELEGEKTRLLVDVGQLEVRHGEGEDEVVGLRRTKAQLQDSVNELKQWKDRAVMRLDEGAQREVGLQQRTAQCERGEKDASDRVAALEQQLQEAQHRLEDMQQEPDETAFLNDQINHHLVTIRELREQLDQLHTRLRFYENDATNRELMTIPRSELSHLKQQAEQETRLLGEIETVKKERDDLKNTIHRLEAGTVECGHEAELRDLKQKADAHNQLLKTQQQQQQKYDDLRDQLQFLQSKINSGETPARDLTSCGVQVRLAESFTLTQLSPEFKTALMKLGAKHPGAYQDFVRHLEPSHKTMSRINVTNPSPSNGNTATQVSSNTSAKRPIESATEHERSRMIGQLVDTLPNEDVKLPGETNMWEEVEKRDPHREAQIKEGPYWSEVEGPTDDLMLTVDVFGMTDDSSSDISIDSPPKVRNTAPPLPSSLPPPTRPRPHIMDSPSDSSFYLPSSQHADDSADEADEIIDEDDGAVPTKFPRGLTPPRARSLERDSDFSEGSFITSSVSPRVVRRRGGKVYRMAGSLESIPDSGTGSMRQDDPLKIMKESVHELQQQLKAKDRELEVSRINQRELEKKVKDVDEAFTLRAKLKDKERQLNVERKRTQQQNKQLGTHQQEVATVRRQLDMLKDMVKDTDGSVTVDLENNVAFLKHSLERKDKYLNDKKNENDVLVKELEKYQKDCHNLKNDYQTAADQLTVSHKQLDELRTKLESHESLSHQYTLLQKQHTALVELHRTCSVGADNMQALEKIILKLRGQLKDADRIQLEHTDLTKRLQELEEQLRMKARVESELTQNNARLQHSLDAATRDLTHLHTLQDQHKKATAKLDEFEEMKIRAQTMLTPLRAQVLRLSKLCKSKDEVISRMADAMKSAGGPTDLLEEVEKEQSTAHNLEYHRPLSPLTQDVSSLPVSPRSPLSEKSPSRIPRLSSRSSEAAKLPRSHSTGNLNPTSLFPENHSTVTIDDFVLTPPQLSMPPVTQLPGSSPRHSRIPRHQNLRGQRHGRTVAHPPTAEQRVMSAVKDYDPQMFSQSGRPTEELPLREGDNVTVLSPADSTGYVRASVDGCEGLVPAAYLQPYNTASSARVVPPTASAAPVPSSRVPKTVFPDEPSSRRSSSSRSISHPAFTGSMLAAPPVSPRSSHLAASHPAFHPHTAPHGSKHQSLVTAVQPPFFLPKLVTIVTGPHSGAVGPTGAQSPPPLDHTHSPRIPDPVSGPPAPPSEFRVQRVVGQHALLLAWTAPPLDELARSNGCTVTGYKILVDSRDQQLIRSPHLCLALVERLNLQRTHNFSIQTMADYGLVSSAITALFHSGATWGVDGELLWSDADSLAADADVSSSTSHQEDSDQRVFVAVYDYKPTTSTTTSAPQLPLSAGDLIITHGSLRDDGFYHAKVGGQIGLVPKAFIEEVAVLNQRHRSGGYSSSQQTLASVEDIPHSNSSHVSPARSHHTSRASSNSHKMATAIV